MKNLESLLRDVLEQTTGERETPHAENSSQTELERFCLAAIDIINEGKSDLLAKLRARYDEIPDTLIIRDDNVIGIIVELVQQHLEEKMHAPEAVKKHVIAFIPPGTEAICVFIYAMIENLGCGASPEALESKRNMIVQSATMLSKFPGPISANLKQLMFRKVHAVMDGDDFSATFRDDVRRILVEGIRKNPEHLAAVKRLSYCPAHANTQSFAEVVFDLFMDAYRHVFEKLAGGKNEIPHEEVQTVRLMAAYASIAHLL